MEVLYYEHSDELMNLGFGFFVGYHLKIISLLSTDPSLYSTARTQSDLLLIDYKLQKKKIVS